MSATLQFTKMSDDAVIPTKAHPSDSGYDITIIGVHKVLSPLVTLYKTGLQVAPSHGFYTELVARSSLMKSGYMLANNVGVLDESYRGEILVALYKFDPSMPDIQVPSRVAQLIVRQNIPSIVEVVEQLSETVRGDGGFGSTGK